MAKGTYDFGGVAAAISNSEIRFFIPLQYWDTTSTVTITALGVVNIWNSTEGKNYIISVNKVQNGLQIRAEQSGKFTVGSAYYFSCTFTIL